MVYSEAIVAVTRYLEVGFLDDAYAALLDHILNLPVAVRSLLVNCGDFWSQRASRYGKKSDETWGK